MLIEWKDEYSVGNEDIDNEHKVFLSLIDQFHRLSERNRPYEKKRFLLELEKYAEFHFVSEENRMMGSGYPDLLAHIREHEQLLAELRQHKIAFEMGKLGIDDICKFLVEWFTTHTVKVDKKMALYLGEQQADN